MKKEKVRQQESAGKFAERLTGFSGKSNFLRKDFCVFDFLAEGIFATDSRLRLMYGNKIFRSVPGMTAANGDEGFAARLEKLLNVSRKKLLSELAKENKFRKEIYFSDDNGEKFSGTVKLNCLKDTNGKTEMIFGIFTDTTELKSAIEKLNRRNSLLNLLNDLIKYTSRSADLNSSVKYAIDKVCQYTQWDIGHCYLFKDNRLVSTNIWNSNLEKIYAEYKDYTETASCIVEKGMPRKCFQTGKLLLLDLLHPKRDFPFKRFKLIKNLGLRAGIWVPIITGKKVEGVLEFFSNSDISSDTEILYAMSNLGIELGSHKDRIEIFNNLKNTEKLAALGRFSVNIAHELRNPLANISALSQLIQKEEINERNRQYLEFILENIQIADKTIKSLLSDVSPADISPIAVDFRIFSEKILEKSRHRFLKKKIRIMKSIAPDLPRLFIDEVKMENALLNLLDNAKDAMPDGGVIKFRVHKRNKDDYVTVKITDQGEGISEDNMDKIFEPFFTTKPNGTGLGMGLTRHAINSHGGTLEIRSRLNTGTTIEIKLPVRKEKDYEQNTSR